MEGIKRRYKALEEYIKTHPLQFGLKISSTTVGTPYPEYYAPGYQEGGYVKEPTLAFVAEKEPEWIIPESKMEKLMGARVTERIVQPVYNIRILNHFYGTEDKEEIIREIISSLKRELDTRKLVIWK